MDEKQIEQQARLLCDAAGFDPDIQVFEPDLMYVPFGVVCSFPNDGDFRPETEPIWHYFRDQARVLLTPPHEDEQ